MHRGINRPTASLTSTLLLIFCQVFCKFSKPLFRQFPIYIVFLFVTPSPKNWWTPIIFTFFIFNPSYLLKVTKFLVKISQFKFLVMADKHLNTSTEHAWFEILHGAQRKLFPKCNFFSQESTKKLTFLAKNSEICIS